MKIRFEQSGGLAGITLSSSVDTNSLPADQREMIENVVSTSDFFNLPASFPPPEGSADYFQYSITIEDDLRKHTVKWTDLSRAPGLDPLVKFMRKNARPSNVDSKY